MPDAGTRLLGVVGHPIAHTLSPALWNPVLEAAGRNAVFLAFDVPPQRFVTFVDGMAAAGAIGLNVTVPHKTAAYDRADVRSAEADGTGAVNVLVFEDGRVVGHNTDVAGVLRALGDLGADLGGARALVLGAGGAGRAAAWALRAAGAEVVLANRTAARAEEVGAEMGLATAPWDDPGFGEVDLVVNATTVGLEGVETPVGAEALAAGVNGRLRWVLDVVYRPDETALVKAAREAGLAAADGLSMLVHQAAEAYTLFFGPPAPIEAMFRAAHEVAPRPERTS